MSTIQHLKQIREVLNIKNIAEDMAANVINDLKKDGYEAELIKHNPKKPKTWRIISKRVLKPNELEEFETIKNNSFDYWRTETENMLKEYRRKIC